MVEYRKIETNRFPDRKIPKPEVNTQKYRINPKVMKIVQIFKVLICQYESSDMYDQFIDIVCKHAK